MIVLPEQRTDSPAITRDLAAAVRFVDIFTRTPVRLPLIVSIPRLRWRASWSEIDATYRFAIANAPTLNGVPQLPTGTFDLRLDLPGRELAGVDPPGVLPRAPYAAFEARRLTLPPAAAHVPVRRDDYLVELDLWPTTAMRVPPGETAVLGRVLDAVQMPIPGARVVLFTGATPPANGPYAHTDSAGQFLFRLPGLRASTPSNQTVQLSVQVRNPANAQLAVNPVTISIAIGRLTPLTTFTQT